MVDLKGNDAWTAGHELSPSGDEVLAGLELQAVREDKVVMPKSKLPTVRVPSDDCTISVGQVIRDGVVVEPGTEYRVHEGEWIEVLPIRTTAEWVAIAKITSGRAPVEGVSDEAAEEAAKEVLQSLGQTFDTLCLELSRRVVAWNWTGLMHEELEQPYNRPDVIAGLTNEEVMWLIGAAQGDTQDQRKNGLEPSVAT